MMLIISPLLAGFFDNLWNRLNGEINGWTLLGLLGNALFSSRFLVQWYASEKRGESVIPVSFWYLSLAGSLVLTVYCIHIGSIPMVLGTLPPTIVYARNLFLIARSKKGGEGGKGAARTGAGAGASDAPRPTFNPSSPSSADAPRAAPEPARVG